mgnify:CR=1 FL=1
MKLTENEKKEILSKYDGTTSDELLNHLKRNFPVVDFKLDWMEKPIKQMLIDDKLYLIDNNKKYLVNKLSNFLEDGWTYLDPQVFRRTIKKFIDGYLL